MGIRDALRLGDRLNKQVRRTAGSFATTVLLSGLIAAANAASAGAFVTVGQLAPGTSPPAICNSPLVDVAQPTVTSGNTFVVPEAGTITSWSTNAAAGAGQSLIMKIYRRATDPAIYAVVGSDGPRALTPSSVNTFPAGVPVMAGDVLGLNSGNADVVNNACDFDVPGDSYAYRAGDLPPGSSGTFLTGTEERLNITATLEPTSAFVFGATARDREKGTATLPVNVPNPGELILSGRGVKGVNATATAAGALKLLVRATGDKRRKLNRTGSVEVTSRVGFTPTGGEPTTKSMTLKLKKRR